jgi:REP element-mobilizing transposase RayT
VPQSYTSLLYHGIFSTKERRRWLQPEIARRVHAFIAQMLRREGGVPVTVNGTHDHVHLLTHVPPNRAVADIMRSIKSNSSRWLHREFDGLAAFAWQDGYSAFTVSRSQRGRVRRYVEAQGEHHRRMSFDEELAALLEAHDIELDWRAATRRV